MTGVVSSAGLFFFDALSVGCALSSCYSGVAETRRCHPMYCTQCKAELPEDAKFCLKCGHNVIGVAPKKKASTATAIITIILAGIAIFLIGASVLYNQSFRRTTTGPSTTYASQPSLPLLPQPRSQVITNTALAVKASSYTYFEFFVAANATNVFVDGHFTATGGSGNDIEVYILTPDEFVNFQNHHQTPTLYNSQRATQDSINAVLPSGAGAYYLVLNNGFSLLTPKAVQASAVLHYTN
jgi:ribosomal protein L40E